VKVIASLLLLSSVAYAADDVVCADDKGHYVVLKPHEKLITQLYYGDAKVLNEVPQHPSGMMTGEWFSDPRHWNKTHNESFRGIDLRGMSSVDYSAEKKTCAVKCGETSTAFKVLPPDEAKKVLASARLAPPLRERVPYALARDPKAVYYYVDRGASKATEKSFRLFVGPKGALKLQKMTDVASDSEGDVFATRTGSLRLILGKQESSWIKGEKTNKLLMIPVDQNLQMIYNELGIYTGERLGTPCDHQ
jgi:hypothetical protein